jgi:hypothetical protein
MDVRAGLPTTKRDAMSVRRRGCSRTERTPNLDATECDPHLLIPPALGERMIF